MSTKSVAQKLLIKPDSTVWLSHPDRFDLIGPLPDSTRLVGGIGEASVAVFFADDAASIRSVLGANSQQVTRISLLWIAYPKGNRTDLNRDSLWPIAAEYGLRPIAQVAIDDVWSALRFRPLQEGENPFAPGH